MNTIREQFHKIGNLHNNITVVAGIAKETLKEFSSKEISSEAREKLQKILKMLHDIEKTTQEADTLTRAVKQHIYEIIDPDAVGPK